MVAARVLDCMEGDTPGWSAAAAEKVSHDLRPAGRPERRLYAPLAQTLARRHEPRVPNRASDEALDAVS